MLLKLLLIMLKTKIFISESFHQGVPTMASDLRKCNVWDIATVGLYEFYKGGQGQRGWYGLVLPLLVQAERGTGTRVLPFS